MSATLAAPKFAPPKIRQTKMLIGGEWVSAADGRTFATYNPATEEKIAEVPEGSARDVDRAVQAARKALEQGPWGKMDARDRGRLLNKLADLVEQNLDELAALETLDNGKPIRDSRAADLPSSSIASAITPAGPTKSAARRSPSAATTSATPAGNRSASPGRSSPGTFRS